jgi:hypothetical protein
MNEKDAIDFLLTVQPMPNDDILTEDLINEYDKVRLYLAAHPTEAALPLLLNSFGNGFGFGVYQLVEDTIAAFPTNLVVENLAFALQSPNEGVRFWASQISERYFDPSLLTPLQSLIHDESPSIRAAAITSLERYLDLDEALRKELEDLVLVEKESWVLSLLKEILRK